MAKKQIKNSKNEGKEITATGGKALTVGVASKEKKALFCALWDLHGYNAFPRQLREEYITALWNDNPDSKKALKKKELFISDDANAALKKILLYDSNLKIFEKFVSRFDELSPKAVRFLKLPPISDKDKKKLQEFSEKSYSMAEGSQEWTIQEVVQDRKENKTKIVVSRRAARIVKARLKESDIPKDTWNGLESCVKERFNNAVNSLQDVFVSVAAPYKFQVAIEFDWENKTTELLSDLAEWNETEGKSDDRQKTRNSALYFIAETLSLENKPDFGSIDVSGIISDPDLRTKIERENTKDYLVVMRGGSYHIKATATKNAEDVRAYLLKFDTDNVTKEAKDYYQRQKTFKGFFDEKTEFDRERTLIQGGPLFKETPLDCTGVFVKAFMPEAGDGEPEIEAVSFEYQNNSGEWIIRTPDYSRRVRDAFVSELNKLSQKPAGRPRPKARSAS